MKVINKSKRLICLNTKAGRVDILPGGAEVDDKRIDSIKNEKVFRALLEAGDIVEVKTKTTSQKGKGE